MSDNSRPGTEALTERVEALLEHEDVNTALNIAGKPKVTVSKSYDIDNDREQVRIEIVYDFA